MKEYDINYEFKFSDKIITSTDDLDKFVKYNGSYKGGSTFPLGNFLTIYTTVLPLYPHLYKELEMDFEWEGKSFIDDGVGEALASIAMTRPICRISSGFQVLA